MKYLLIVFFLILIYPIFSTENIDSCNCEAERILLTFQRLKNKYIEISNLNLLNFIKEDNILKKNFLVNDSLNLEKFQIIVYPILKLDPKAVNYFSGENICKYFEFDTINFECCISYYKDTKLVFFMSPDCNDCYIDLALAPGGKIIYCTGKIIFQQFYYDESNQINKEHCTPPYSEAFQILPSDTNLTFWVDGLESFIIKEDKIFMTSLIPNAYSTGYESKYENVLVYINNSINEDWIRYCAKRCSVGGIPWWEFWNWKIFYKKPKYFK